MMRGFLGDVRQSIRALVRRPGFRILTVLTLAVGIGAATAVYSLSEAALFRALPIPGADRLVGVTSTHPVRGWAGMSVSYPDFVDFSSRSDLLSSASFYRDVERDLSGGGEPWRLLVTQVHKGFFETLGSNMVLGRALDDGDQAPDAEPTVVLSEDLWRSRFGADRDVLGATVRLDGVPHTVVGVVQREHQLPVMSQVWVPLQFGDTPPDWAAARSNHTWRVVARLADGVDVTYASDQIGAMARTFYADVEDERDRGMAAEVAPLRAATVNSAEKNIFLMMGVAVFLVLAIACMNASGLMMTHLSGRGRELSLRTALGAGQGRIVGQLLVESLLLALLGGVLGTVLATFGLDQLIRLGPPEMSEFLDIQLNGMVLAGALGISILATLLAGLLPALRASRTSPAEAMKDGSVQSGEARSSHRLRRGLVVAEVAVSVMLLTGAGLTIRSFQAQITGDPGFDPEGVVSFAVRIPATRYEDGDQIRSFYADAVRRVAAVPGIQSVSAASVLPCAARPRMLKSAARSASSCSRGVRARFMRVVWTAAISSRLAMGGPTQGLWR